MSYARSPRLVCSMTVGTSMSPPEQCATVQLHIRPMMCNSEVARMMNPMRVTREVVLDCSTDDAWELLTDASELAEWLGRPIDFELHQVGDRELSFVWSDGGREPSRVEFALEEVDGGTRLTVTETALRASVAGGIARLPIGANWEGRLFDLEVRCLSRATVLV